MSIEARIITDSINTTGDRITTYILRYPRKSVSIVYYENHNYREVQFKK